MDDDSYNQSLSLTMDDSMLPRHWQKLCDGKYCKVEVGANGLGQVTITLVVEPDKSVSAFVRVICGGSNDNPTAYQAPHNAATLVQQQSVYHDLKSMNVQSTEESLELQTVTKPLPKCTRRSG